MVLDRRDHVRGPISTGSESPGYPPLSEPVSMEQASGPSQSDGESATSTITEDQRSSPASSTSDLQSAPESPPFDLWSDTVSPPSNAFSESASPPFDLFSEWDAPTNPGRETSTPSPIALSPHAQFDSPPFDLFTPTTSHSFQSPSRSCTPTPSAQAGQPPFDLFSEPGWPGGDVSAEAATEDDRALESSEVGHELTYCLEQFRVGRYRCVALVQRATERRLTCISPAIYRGNSGKWWSRTCLVGPPTRLWILRKFSCNCLYCQNILRSKPTATLPCRAPGRGGSE